MSLVSVDDLLRTAAAGALALVAPYALALCRCVAAAAVVGSARAAGSFLCRFCMCFSESAFVGCTTLHAVH